MKILIENKIEKFKKQHKLKAKFNIKVQSEAIKKGSNKPDSRYEDLGRLLDSKLPSFELRNISSELEILIKQKMYKYNDYKTNHHDSYVFSCL